MVKYDIIDNGNGTLCLDLAVPGFSKEDLEIATREGIIEVKSITRPPSGYTYRARGIATEVNETISLNRELRAESALCDLGILRILLVPAPALELKATIKIC